jgi:hypothetical protein
MIYRYLTFILTLLMYGNHLFGQCPPTGFPAPGNTCVQAPILCGTLDGYCATINNNNVVQQYPSCPGWTLNNDEWFGFIASSTTITIKITPSNCSGGNPGQEGLQAAVYQTCVASPIARQCQCSTDPFMLTANNYVIGQLYYFVIDGCQGDVCDYEIAVTEGSMGTPPPGDPDPISGTTDVCKGGTNQYTIPPVSNATFYTWKLDPPIGTISFNQNIASITWKDTMVNTATLCVYASNLCFSSPNPACLTINLKNGPTLDLGPDIVNCSDTAVVLHAGAGYVAYLWQDSSTLSTLAVTAPGNYWVEVTDSCGITQRDTVHYTVSLLTDTQFPDVSICIGDSTSFSAPGFSSYQWMPANGLSCTDCPSVNAGPTVTTEYILLASDSLGCILNDTFKVVVLPLPTKSLEIEFCPGASVQVGGLTYTQPGTVIDTIASTGVGCDTVATYLLKWLPLPTKSLEIEFCPGTSVQVGGLTYTQPGTVVDTIASTGIGCDTIATYLLKWLPVPTKSIDIEFCPGTSVSLNGVNYTQPTTVLDTIPTNSVGCDTVVTYHLKYISLPQPSTVDIQCPAGKTVVIPAGATQTVVSYNTPTGSTDCPCGGASIQRTQGLASGANFPVGVTKVCYTASDSCGNTNSCCFNITVENEPDADACDVKNTACIKFELLDIFQNPAKQKTYRMRVTNTCTNKLVYVAYQLPNGVVADKPLNGATYSAPSGRAYEVRNPNYTPTYSIRFKSVGDGIANGQSDIFEYTLPPQADPTFIHAVARLEPQIYYETHLNVFYCPIQQTQSKTGDAATEDREISVQKTVRIYPNPASDLLFVDLSAWERETIHLKVTDALGRTLQDQQIEASADPLDLRLPKSWAQGVYQLEIIPSVGKSQTLRFVIER